MHNYNNIIKEFIDEHLYYLLFDKYDMANMTFYFKEDEAKNVINNHIINNINNGYKFNMMREIYNAINNIDYSKPIMEISNYKDFFNYLSILINLYLKKDKYILDDLNNDYINQIYRYTWLRMTPDDLKNPEYFLKKQIEIFKDKTFNTYNEITNKDFNLIDNSKLSIKNSFANKYDESIKKINFSICKEQYKYILPVIRYGIYKNNQEKVCEIGSIQKLKHYNFCDYNLYKDVNKLRYRLNKEVENELICNVEPSKLITLLLFIKLLIENDIHTISIPSLYVFDYEYHEKRNDSIESLFKSKWSESKKTNDPIEYKIELKEYLSTVNKQDLISENKTTNFIHLFERLLYHIEDAKIMEYPNEVSSYMKIKVNSLNNIKGEYVKKLIK